MAAQQLHKCGGQICALGSTFLRHPVKIPAEQSLLLNQICFLAQLPSLAYLGERLASKSTACYCERLVQACSGGREAVDLWGNWG